MRAGSEACSLAHLFDSINHTPWHQNCSTARDVGGNNKQMGLNCAVLMVIVSATAVAQNENTDILPLPLVSPRLGRSESQSPGHDAAGKG